MIYFFTEDIDFDLSLLSFTPPWVIAFSEAEGFSIDSLNFIFCSDQYLLQINRDYLQHDYFTDIITFDNSEAENILEGDIFISVDRVLDNATHLQTSFFQELLRVIAHGVLHLIGFDDKDEISKNTMRLMEDKFLNLYFNDFHKSE